MRLVRRFSASPSMVVAVLALLVSLTGTSIAAVSQLAPNSVGTPQLKKGAVTSAKVKNRTLTRADFQSGALLRGPRGPGGPAGPIGPAGPAGAAGAAGTAGPRGPSNAIQAIDIPVTFWTTEFTDMRSIALPAGTWVVTATGVANSLAEPGTTEEIECRLLIGGESVDDIEDVFLDTNGVPGGKVPVTLVGARALATASTAALQCRSTGEGNMAFPSLVAIQVETLTDG
jgi:hypothetical protein